MHWAVANKWIAAAPYVWVPQKPPPRNRFLTKAEAKKLIDAAEMPHIKLFIRLALSTAGRAGAILSLTLATTESTRRTARSQKPRTLVLATSTSSAAVSRYALRLRRSLSPLLRRRRRNRSSISTVT